MADVFYFSSPRKAATVVRHRPSVRRTFKAIRQRRAVNAEMFDQHACVARFDEPTFCPSNATSLFVSRPSLPGLSARPSDTQPAFTLQHDLELDDDEVDEENEEDETGGVLLPPYDDDHMIDVNTMDPFTTIHYDQDTQRDSNVDDNTLQNAYVSDTPTSIPTAQHRRRSHSRDSRNESDSRRTRLALEGEIFDEEPRFDVEAATSHGASIAAMGPPRHPAIPGTPSTQLDTPPARSHTNIPSMAQHPPAPGMVSPHSFTGISPSVYGQEIDEDALAVDDPRRHYDVADFMDIWRLNSIVDKRIPQFEPGVQSSIRLGRPQDQITRAQVAHGVVDMQGIRWQTIGPKRRHALVARSMLHPSSGIDHQRSKQLYRPPGHVGDPERHYHFRSFIPKHKASFEHYQLRNVLAATDRNNVFYGAAGNKVMRASLACPAVQEAVMDLAKPTNTAAAFRITCLSASSRSIMPGYQRDNVLIAGGFYGEYAIANVDSNQGQVSEGFVTHAYNGLVTHAHSYQDRRSGLLRAAFCSNDNRVRLMDIHNLQFTDCFVYDNAINSSATSADGRLRVLVGDSAETLITDAERGSPLITLNKHTDHGFACAWSQDGRHVATAAQDGCVVVWDARNWKEPLRTLDSTITCARSLNFTDNGALVAAENEDVVTVYDGPSFDTKQEIRFFGSVAGVALLDGGAELAVANTDKTVGGLLTFERQPQGISGSSYRHIVAKPGAQGSFRWRNGRALRETETLPDILV
ncbi:Putative WD40/YVTN repeat-like-containing domain superfamily [Septoria linicola]|uniref:WD40/YVTN repeat-like-containing domain superfamily n=1 Tax=Septoria linicola TaxID=215465 RepID=A0A9Q9AX00_9PEZI|nr:putative WD40/YVTN repeat-like-containing domain superfamily [Septoria linicola]USW54728.1 Putative WD40/YVTN repeat-like-containing domain superfamily [Septoria linicola]